MLRSDDRSVAEFEVAEIRGFTPYILCSALTIKIASCDFLNQFIRFQPLQPHYEKVGYLKW